MILDIKWLVRRVFTFSLILMTDYKSFFFFFPSPLLNNVHNKTRDIYQESKWGHFRFMLILSCLSLRAYVVCVIIIAVTIAGHVLLLLSLITAVEVFIYCGIHESSGILTIWSTAAAPHFSPTGCVRETELAKFLNLIWYRSHSMKRFLKDVGPTFMHLTSSRCICAWKTRC